MVRWGQPGNRAGLERESQSLVILVVGRMFYVGRTALHFSSETGMKLVHVVLAAISLVPVHTAFAQTCHELVVTDDNLGSTVSLGLDDILVVRLRATLSKGSSQQGTAIR